VEYVGNRPNFRLNIDPAMASVVRSIVTKYNLTPANSPKELGQHVPELDTKLENRRARNNARTVLRQLGFSEGQVKFWFRIKLQGVAKAKMARCTLLHEAL
jgi:hypothetical protein